VLKAAQSSDPLARDMVDQAAQALFKLIHSVITQLPQDEARISLAGGLLERDNALRKSLFALLRTHLPRAQTATAAPEDSVKGACLLARAALEKK
jgi:N-acetylglucosamine kinase-like BadF-type ATPase